MLSYLDPSLLDSQKLRGRRGSLLEINRCGEATNENGGGKMKGKGKFHCAVYFFHRKGVAFQLEFFAES